MTSEELLSHNELNRTQETSDIQPNDLNQSFKELSISSMSDKLNHENLYSDKILQTPDSTISCLPCRYVVSILGFFALFFVNTTGIGTSISVVAMVNNSAVKSRKNSNVSIVSCTFNESTAVEHYVSDVGGEFDWSPAVQGYILSSCYLGFFSTQLAGGLMAQKYGAKVTIITGLFLTSTCHLIVPFIAWISSYWVIADQLFLGFGQGLLPGALSVVAANWYPNTERGLLNSFTMSGYPVGSLVSGGVSGYICSSSLLGGWQSVFYIYGGFGLVICLFFQVFFYESPKCHPRIQSSELIYISENQEMDLSQKRFPTPWKKILTSVPVYAMVYSVFVSFWMVSHFLSVQPIYLGTILQFPIQENGFLTSAIFLFQMLLTYIGMWISKFLTAHNYIGVDKVRKGNTMLCCLGYSVGLLGVYFAGCNRTTSAIFAIIAMSSSGLSYISCRITPVDMSPTFAGTLMGFTNTVATIAGFIFPSLVGLMTDKEQTLEQWNKIFMISIGIAMSSGIIFCLFGSADVQPWNFPPENEIDKNNLKDNVNNRAVEVDERHVESSTYL